MALIGETGGSCNLGQRQFAIAHQLDGAAKAQVNDIAIGTDADLAAKYTRKMELAATAHSRQRGDIDRLIQMRHQVIPDLPACDAAEEAVRRLGPRRVAGHKPCD